MKGKSSRGNFTNLSRVKSRTCSNRRWRPGFPAATICLLWALTGTATGAFEGADLFRTTLAGVKGIFPPAMNSPARLPDQPVWLSLGRGQPLGRAWAAYSTASLGGRIGNWRVATGIWSSGDELYRETSLAAALAKRTRNRLSAGISLAYYKVSIGGFDPIKGELLIGLALAAPLTESLDVAVWYSGQPPTQKRAYESLARQLFQLAVTRRSGENYAWSLAVEKTPAYALRQLAEVSVIAWREVKLQLGYRTAPGMPYVGVELPLRRLLLSVRLNYHPIFGLSTAFGFAFK